MKGDLLKGSRCVVTGASRGIGKAIAEAFAKCGADVLITYVSNKAKADETVAEMEKYGVNAYSFRCDAGDEEDTKRLADYIKEVFGSIDVLVNNAGAIGEEAPITQITSDEWDRIMRVDDNQHIFGAFGKRSCKLHPLYGGKGCGKRNDAFAGTGACAAHSGQHSSTRTDRNRYDITGHEFRMGRKRKEHTARAARQCHRYIGCNSSAGVKVR